MAPITTEEENFLRIVQLISKVVVEAVRTMFDKLFSPINLYQTLQAKQKDLKDLAKRRILTKSQMDDLYPISGKL